MFRSRDPFDEAAQGDLARLRDAVPKDPATQRKADQIVAKSFGKEEQKNTEFRDEWADRVDDEIERLREERSRPQPRPKPPEPGVNPLHPEILRRDAERNVEIYRQNEIIGIRRDRDRDLRNLIPPHHNRDHGDGRPPSGGGGRDDGSAPAMAENPRKPDDDSGGATFDDPSRKRGGKPPEAKTQGISDEMRQRIAEKAARYEREFAQERAQNRERGRDFGRSR